MGQARQEKHTDSYRRQDNHARVCEKRKSERRPNGSTLIIAVAQDQDAGKYKCTLTLRDAVQEVEHTVIVRGEKIIVGTLVQHVFCYRGTLDPLQHPCQIVSQSG